MAIDVFISYAHEDRELREELAKHLSSLRNVGIINDWFDGDIGVGTEWEKQLLDHLNRAQIILLLVSADFIASKFCYNIEMPQALARHKENRARVIPIILRSTSWEETPFARLEVLPTGGKAITLWPTHDEAFVDVVSGIKRAIRDLQGGVSHSNNTTFPETQKPLSHRNVSTDMQLTPVSTNSTHNHIGSISGNNHSIVQAGTQSTTTNNYYGFPVEGHRGPSKKRRTKGKKEE
jgi:hypothetical protein